MCPGLPLRPLLRRVLLVDHACQQHHQHDPKEELQARRHSGKDHEKRALPKGHDAQPKEPAAQQITKRNRPLSHGHLHRTEEHVFCV